MTKHDCLGEFDKALEDWESYIERLKHCFTANCCHTGEKASNPPLFVEK